MRIYNRFVCWEIERQIREVDEVIAEGHRILERGIETRAELLKFLETEGGTSEFFAAVREAFDINEENINDTVDLIGKAMATRSEYLEDLRRHQN